MMRVMMATERLADLVDGKHGRVKTPRQRGDVQWGRWGTW